MQAINLLPKDLIPKKSILKLSGTIKRISMIGYSLLLVTVVVGIGVVIMLSRQINLSKSRQEGLIAKITSYEQTEQQLVLIKDRLNKADKVLTTNSALPEIEVFSQLLQLFPGGVSLDQTGITSNGTQINLAVQSSSALVELFASLLSSKLYQSVELNSFSYDSLNGYRISLSLKT